MPNTFTPSSLRSAVESFNPQGPANYSPEDLDFAKQTASNLPGQGLVSGAYSQVSGLKGVAGSLADALGAHQTAQSIYGSARADAQSAAEEAPSVHSIHDIHGAGDAAKYVLGNVGQFASYAPLAAVGGLAGRAIGGSARAAELSSAGALQPVLAGSEALRLNDDPAARNMSPGERLLRSQGLGTAQTLIGAGIPTYLGNRLGARNPATSLGQVGRNFAADVGKSTAVGSAGLAGIDAAGQLAQQTYDPDKHFDPQQTLEAAASGAAGGLPLAVPHAALAGGLDVAAAGGNFALRAAKKGAGLAADAGQAAVAAGKAATDNLGPRVPGSIDDAAEQVGAAASAIKGKVLNVIDRITGKPEDPDTATLLAPEPKNATPDILQADDVNKHEAAARLAQQVQESAASTPPSVRAAAERYLSGGRTLDSYKELAETLRDWNRGQKIDQAASSLSEAVADAVGKGVSAAKGAVANTKTAYDYNEAVRTGRLNAQTAPGDAESLAAFDASRGNAQTPKDDGFNRLLAESLFRDTGLVNSDLVHPSSLLEAAKSLRDWISSWNENTQTSVPRSIYDSLSVLHEDPASTVEQAHNLLQRQGLVSEDTGGVLGNVVEQLRALKDAEAPAGRVVNKYLLPTAREQFDVKSRADLEEVGRHLQQLITQGKADDPVVDTLFGPHKEAALAALHEQTPRRSSGLVESTGEERDSPYDEHGNLREGGQGQTFEEAGQLTSNPLDPNVVGQDVLYHHYRESTLRKNEDGTAAHDEHGNPALNDDAKPYDAQGQILDKKNIDPETGEIRVVGTQDAHATARAKELQARNSSTVTRQGYVDHLRARFADNPEALVKHTTAFVRDNAHLLQPNERAQAAAVLNKRFFVLREQRAQDRGQPHDVSADEFNVLTPGAKGNKWAEFTGKNGGKEAGTASDGKIWLERADGTKFATSATKIIKRMLAAGKKEGRAHEAEGLAGQKDLLTQGLSSLLSAKDAEGNHALTGRIGFLHDPKGSIDWNSKEIPDDLRLYGKPHDTLGKAKEQAETQRLDNQRADLGGYAERIEKVFTDDKGFATWKASDDAQHFLMRNPESRREFQKAVQDGSVGKLIKTTGDVKLLDALYSEVARFKESDRAYNEGKPKEVAPTYETVRESRREIVSRGDDGQAFKTKKEAQEHVRFGGDDRVVKDKDGRWVIERVTHNDTTRAVETPAETEEFSANARDDKTRTHDLDGNALHPRSDDDRPVKTTPDFPEAAQRQRAIDAAIRGIAAAEKERKTAVDAKQALVGSYKHGEVIPNDKLLAADQRISAAEKQISTHEATLAERRKDIASLRHALEDSSAKADLPGAPDKAVTGYVLDKLRKGLPAFNEALKKATEEQRGKISDALKAMLEAKSPDSPVWRGEPPKNMEEFAKRGRLALKTLEATEPAKERSERGAGAQNEIDQHYRAEMEKNRVDITKTDPNKPVWGVVESSDGSAEGRFLAAFNDASSADYYAEHVRDGAVVNSTVRDFRDIAEKQGSLLEGEAKPSGKPDALSRSNALGPIDEKPASPAEQKKFVDDAVRRLGPQIKATLHEELFGRNEKGEAIKLSGQWEPGVIRASKYAADIGQIGAHEAMHEFFHLLTADGKNSNKVSKILLDAANSAPVVRQLERLLDDHPDAIAQIKDGAEFAAEERLAYAFQFHQAGLLKLGPETTSTFQKIANFFRRVVGLLSNDQKADRLLRAFDEGKTPTADAAAKVLANNIEYRERLIKSANETIRPLTDKLSRLVSPVGTGLDRTGNSALIDLRKDLKTHVGEGGKLGLLDGTNHQLKIWSNKLAGVVRGLQPKDLELAAKYLNSGETPHDATTARIVDAVRGNEAKGVKGLLPELHDYFREAGVARFDEAKKEWIPIGKRKNYYTQSFDTSKIISNTGDAVATLLEHNRRDLEGIAKTANEEVATNKAGGLGTASQKALEDGRTSVTAEDVAQAIVQRMLTSHGNADPDLNEHTGSIGYTPLQSAVNRRTLDWLSPTFRKKFGETDMVKTLTSYIAQGTKRAEYTRRFGPGGERIRAKMDEAQGIELNKLVEAKYGVTDAYAKALEAKAKIEARSKEPVSLVDVLTHGINQQGKDIGASAKDVQALLDQSYAKLAGPARDIMAMEGTLGHDINPKLRRFQNSLAVYQNYRTMGLSLFSQLIDPLGIAVRGGSMNDAWHSYLRGIKEVAASWRGEHTHDEEAQAAEMLGTVDAHGFLAGFGQTYSSLHMGKGFRKANDILFRANGMEGFNRGMQISATTAAVNFIKRNVESPDKFSKERLAELDLHPGDVKIVDGKLDYRDPKIQAAVYRWTYGAIMRPNAGQRPAWMSDPHFMMFSHFKSFSYAMHDTILKRAYHEVQKYGDLGPAATLAAVYTPIMIAADAAKAILLSGSEPPWLHEDLGSVIAHGANRAGLAGYAQPGLDALTPGRSPFGIAGPTVEQAAQAFTDPVGDTLHQALPFASVLNTIGGGKHRLPESGED
jgi:hypothetical protein